jgi:hypothetical protein
VLTRLLAQERQGLRSTVACSVCGCRRRAGTRRALVGTRSTRCQARSARVAVSSGTCKRPARLDGRLSSDGGSARRRGAGQQVTPKQRAHKARSSLGSKAGSTTRSRGFLTSRSWTRRRGSGEGLDEGNAEQWQRGP